MALHSALTRLVLSVGTLALAAALTGCGSKEEEVAATPAPAAEPAATEETASSNQEGSTTDDINVSQMDVTATMTAADKAMKQSDYVAATDALLKIQMSGAMKNNDQAKLDHYSRMVELQKRVADAAASGDPKAQRAAALLRQGSAGR